MYRESEKNLLKQQYLFHMSSQCYELQPTSGWDWFVSLGHPANFNGFRVLALLQQRRRSTEVNQTLHDAWPSPALVYCVCILGGLPPNGISIQLQNSLCVQVSRFPILAALLHGTRAAAVSQTLWIGTRNGITELAQMAPPIFGREAITLASAHILVEKNNSVFYTLLSANRVGQK